MPSLKKIGAVAAALASVVSAYPAYPKLTSSQMKLYELSKRQNAAAAALGMTDIDLLQL